MRYEGNNKCCCGDMLSGVTPGIDTTYKEITGNINISEYAKCKIKGLFSSNRNTHINTVEEYYKENHRRELQNRQMLLF
jgi:hypothetical protein